MIMGLTWQEKKQGSKGTPTQKEFLGNLFSLRLSHLGVDSAHSCDEVKLFFGYVQNCIIYSPKAQPG